MKRRYASFADYAAYIRSLLDEYRGVIVDLALEVFEATPSEGFIRGSLMFPNGSRLHFLEYVRLVGGRVIKSKYRYHFEDPQGRLVFRYDNAPHHREVESFPHHKHLADGRVVSSEEPSLEDVLREALLHTSDTLS